MSAAPVTPDLEVVPAGEPTMFGSPARLVPDDLRAAYYHVLAHTRTLSPDDEMLRILESDRYAKAWNTRQVTSVAVTKSHSVN